MRCQRCASRGAVLIASTNKMYFYGKAAVKPTCPRVDKLVSLANVRKNDVSSKLFIGKVRSAVWRVFEYVSSWHLFYNAE